jgi:hypothetical protein
VFTIAKTELEQKASIARWSRTPQYSYFAFLFYIIYANSFLW